MELHKCFIHDKVVMNTFLLIELFLVLSVAKDDYSKTLFYITASIGVLALLPYLFLRYIVTSDILCIISFLHLVLCKFISLVSATLFYFDQLDNVHLLILIVGFNLGPYTFMFLTEAKKEGTHEHADNVPMFTD